MLILPLHRPLNRQTFPLLTAALVLVNLFVFAFLQSGDRSALARATQYYDDSGLATLEAPPFERYLAEPSGADLREQLERFPSELRADLAAAIRLQDRGFRARLADGELFDDAAAHAAWKSSATRYDELRARVFTERWAFDAQRPEIGPLIASMFLHGGVDHLLGNMLFLIALGLLVERPLGAALFGTLYLLGGMAAGLAWLALHGGGPGSVIGASGAIASLMGAFCVLWGRRRVRFFYWFFVVFDYVRAPALLLLPLWLGWELLQMVLSGGSRVAYSAHAGGIVAGAALAFVVTRAGWHDAQWLDADDNAAAGIDGRLQQALQHLGRMELDACERLLASLAAEAAERADIVLARLRCARYRGDRAQVVAQLRRLIEHRGLAAAELHELATLLGELEPSQWHAVAAAARCETALRLAAIGASEAAFMLSQPGTGDADRGATWPQHWLRLAFRSRDGGHMAAMRDALQQLVERYPDSTEADKARFLLREEGEAARS